ncbi:MAG TPA: GtrA family protein [Rhizobiales bacterium]|nr:GtrA family protein [Hyphomicrobiales bacterium]
MTIAEALGTRTAPSVPTWRTDLAIGMAAALLAVLFHAVSGFPSLVSFNGDNDNLMRLAEVRDLIGGQGWFDLHQYRMGPAGGFLMHWSRLVDAPIAALILLGEALSGDRATGETAALVLWPALLFGAALFFILRSARRLGGAPAVLPAVVVGGAALHFISIFAPGAIDHHNVQLVLTLAVIAALAGPAPGLRGGAVAGASAAAMLAVGMETAPYVAAGGLTAATLFLAGGADGRRVAAGFGAAFAGAATLAFAATVDPAAWGVPACDAYSVAQFAVAMVSGGGLAAASVLPGPSATPVRRLAALALIGVAAGGLAVVFFPHCLADPYAGLDPRLQKYWLAAITEAQSLASVLSAAPAMAVSYYATPVLAALVLAAGLRRPDGRRREAVIVLVFLGAALAVSVWQVRGAMFSIPIAAIALAAWIGRRRALAAASPSPHNVLLMAVAWVASINVASTAAAERLLPVSTATAMATPAGRAKACHRATDYDRLAALPAGGVLAISNLGAPILRYTAHRVLAGPYHRNVDGNLLALRAFLESEPSARAVVREEGLSYVALCAGNDETATFAAWAPDGFLAALKEGDVPAWLEPLPGNDGSALAIYRVVAAD